MQLRIGIASIGLISNDFLVSLATLNSEHYKVVAVCAAPADQLDQLEKFANKFGIPKSYGSSSTFSLKISKVLIKLSCSFRSFIS